jgi:hypothetical protein
VVVIDPDDIALLIIRNNCVCEALIDRDILLVARALIKALRLGGIRDNIMQAWPKNMVTVIIVVLSKLVVWDPNRRAIVFLDHAMVNVPAERVIEGICICAEGSNPALALEAPLERIYCVSETTVSMRIRLNVVLATNG